MFEILDSSHPVVTETSGVNEVYSALLITDGEGGGGGGGAGTSPPSKSFPKICSAQEWSSK